MTLCAVNLIQQLLGITATRKYDNSVKQKLGANLTVYTPNWVQRKLSTASTRYKGNRVQRGTAQYNQNSLRRQHGTTATSY